MKSALRMGILGAARIAPQALIEPARGMREVVVQAVAARDPERARRFARRYGIGRVHEDYRSLVEDPELDGVYIALPASLHAEWCLRALKHGKHVLCEKPLAANQAEAESIREAVGRSGCRLMEAFHYRYHPLAGRIKEWMAHPELGPIRHLESVFCVPLLSRGDIRYAYGLAGGATLDVGCYPINLIRYLAGAEPQVISARARLTSPQIDRYMEADLRFESGVTARMVCSLFSWRLLDSRAAIQLAHGDVRVRNPFAPHYHNRLTVRVGGRKEVESVAGETTFTYQLRAFAAAVRGEAEILTGADDAVANLRTIDAIYMAAGLKPRGKPLN